MKGIVFTVFLDMVETKYGYETVDELVSNPALQSEGIYPAVGTYSHKELVIMASELALKIDEPVTNVVRSFGKHLFGAFLKSYPHFFEHSESAFDFLESINDYIHVEVKKLYPEAELPSFLTERPEKNTLLMRYSSVRGMSALAEGLIESTLNHYKTPGSIQVTEAYQGTTDTLFTIKVQ